MVRAKVICNGVTKSLHWRDKSRFIYTAKFQPVTSGSEENKRFFEATPSGSIELGTFNDDYFHPGKEYYVDFTEISDTKAI